VDRSGQGPLPSTSCHSHSLSGQTHSISDRKSFQSLQKSIFGCQNQSVSTVRTIREPESIRSSTASFTPRQNFRLASLEDEAEPSLPSAPHPFRTIAPTLVTGPSPSPVYAITPSPPSDDGDFPPLAAIETSTTSSIELSFQISRVLHGAPVAIPSPLKARSVCPAS
jgi:hypothetical protein